MTNKFLISILFVILVSCNSKPREVLRENEYYVCSMDPQVMEKQPGPCPICKMPLTKAIIDNSQQNIIKLSKEQIKLGNIRTDTVRITSISDEKTLTGTFAINQNLVQQISSRFSGRIEKLYFKIPGQQIKEGDLIYEVYSRDLMLAEEEFISASNAGISETAKNRLLIWGLTEDQIEKLATEKKAKIVNPVYSKVSGTITEIPFKEGDYIDEGSTIFKLADLSSLWVEAQVY
ncbi:MAG TPA: efflux RND transporter periplasmic adaptor subunit, partial [Bacteroidia bacterium]|nr:efflux RND transporter periplasmic adaptor subunit [Bacteroidia bacterium]